MIFHVSRIFRHSSRYLFSPFPCRMLIITKQRMYVWYLSWSQWHRYFSQFANLKKSNNPELCSRLEPVVKFLIKPKTHPQQCSRLNEPRNEPNNVVRKSSNSSHQLPNYDRRSSQHISEALPRPRTRLIRFENKKKQNINPITTPTPN